jgi:two-component system sensor histidine kinase DegS
MRDDRKYNAALLAVADREQQRLAEDLHDTVCQNLVGISLMVKLLLRRAEAGKGVAASELAKINAYVEEAVEHSRAPLRSQILARSETGLVKALEEMVHLGRKGLLCRLEAVPDLKIHDPRVAQVLYRIAEDAFRETMRRARAKEMSIVLRQEKDEVVLEIRSDGFFAEAAKSVQDDELLLRFADAVGVRLKIERKDGCVHRAVAPNEAKPAEKKG